RTDRPQARANHAQGRHAEPYGCLRRAESRLMDAVERVHRCASDVKLQSDRQIHNRHRVTKGTRSLRTRHTARAFERFIGAEAQPALDGVEMPAGVAIVRV